MNAKHIAIILGAAMAMASCSSDEAVMPAAGSSMLRIVTEMPSRAFVEGSSFLPGDTIGLVITQSTQQGNIADSNGNDQVLYDDVFAVFNGAEWELSEQIDLSLYTGSVSIKGYYPYGQLSHLGTAIVRFLLPGDTDYMMASGTASAQSPVASLAFEHQMVRLDTKIMIMSGVTSDEIVDSIVVEDVMGWGLHTLANNPGNISVRYPDQVNVKAVVNKPLSSLPEASFALLKSDYVLYPVKVYTDRAIYSFEVPGDFSSMHPGQSFTMFLYLEPIGQ